MIASGCPSLQLLFERRTTPFAIIATGLQPSDDGESAVIETLAPGQYTAIVRGAGNTSGVALVEAYNVQ